MENADKKILFNISGPYAVGKDTMLNAVIAQYTDRVHRVSSLTTRPSDSSSDPSYKSVSDRQFDEITSKNEWISNQQLGGKYRYGTSIDEIRAQASNGKISVHSIFAGEKGAQKLREIFGKKLLSIALLAVEGSFEDQVKVLEERMLSRGRETIDVIRRKLHFQHEQIDFILANPTVESPDGKMKVFDEVVINEELEATQSKILQLFKLSFNL